MLMSARQWKSCCLLQGLPYLQGGGCDLHAGERVRAELLLLFDVTDLDHNQEAALQKASAPGAQNLITSRLLCQGCGCAMQSGATAKTRCCCCTTWRRPLGCGRRSRSAWLIAASAPLPMTCAACVTASLLKQKKYFVIFAPARHLRTAPHNSYHAVSSSSKGLFLSLIAPLRTAVA